MMNDEDTPFDPVAKYPRTFHLPWSEGATGGDRKMSSVRKLFECPRVIVTEKMDGENTTMTSTRVYARSVGAMRSTVDRDWVKKKWAEIKNEIQSGWRICGENLYARHSIEYTDLPSYFLGFSVWDERGLCLSWDDTLDRFDSLGIVPVPTLYDGPYDEDVIRALWSEKDFFVSEGYVVRDAGAFEAKDFSKKVGKFVRLGHVTTSDHWRNRPIVKNGLSGRV